MPVERYCHALRTWGNCIIEAYKDDNTKIHLESLARNIQNVKMAIYKSNLLYRLIYLGQKVRNKKCPKHNGTWSGMPSPETDCPHGCDLTGWIHDDFVPTKPGDPCPHKWFYKDLETKEVLCYHCNEKI